MDGVGRAVGTVVLAAKEATDRPLSEAFYEREASDLCGARRELRGSLKSAKISLSRNIQRKFIRNRVYGVIPTPMYENSTTNGCNKPKIPCCEGRYKVVHSFSVFPDL